MNHRIVAVVWFAFLLLTASAFSQTGYSPAAPGRTQYPAAGQYVNPSPAGNNYNGAPVTPVPNSGFDISGQGGALPANGSYSTQTTPQRTAMPNPQNGSYVPQPSTGQPQSFGQPQPVGQPQSFGQPQPVGQPQSFGQPQPVGQPQSFGQPQPGGQPQSFGQPQPVGQPQSFGQPQPGGQPAVPLQSNAPFELTPQEQDNVNRVLAFWESYTRGIKKFEADFDLYSYPAVSVGGTDVNSPPKAQQTTGFLKYEAPNKGVFRIDGPPKELYRCNGKSVYTYNFDKKEINEYKYSDGSITGQELKKGPMAFLFGASAATLRDRYWIRLLPLPPGAPQGQIWLEAYPKYQEDLQDMTKAELIINVRPCKPVAFQRYSPNGDRQSYALKNIKVNKFELFGGEPFEPNERGWTVITSSQSE